MWKKHAATAGDWLGGELATLGGVRGNACGGDEVR